MTDIKNVIHELNILKRRVRKYASIIKDQNRIIRTLRISNINLNTGLHYYKNQANSELRSDEDEPEAKS